jgi:hypothetical protein
MTLSGKRHSGAIQSNTMFSGWCMQVWRPCFVLSRRANWAIVRTQARSTPVRAEFPQPARKRTSAVFGRSRTRRASGTPGKGNRRQTRRCCDMVRISKAEITSARTSGSIIPFHSECSHWTIWRSGSMWYTTVAKKGRYADRPLHSAFPAFLSSPVSRVRVFGIALVEVINGIICALLAGR